MIVLALAWASTSLTILKGTSANIPACETYVHISYISMMIIHVSLDKQYYLIKLIKP